MGFFLKLGVAAAILFAAAPGSSQDLVPPIYNDVYDDSLIGAERAAVLQAADREAPLSGGVDPAELFRILLFENRGSEIPSLVRRAVAKDPERRGDIANALVRIKDVLATRDGSGAIRKALLESVPDLRFRIETPRDEPSPGPELERIELSILQDSYSEERGPAALAALKKFASENPGTAAAAKALYVLGRAYENDLPEDPRNDADTGRLIDTLEIVKELVSGRYPPSEWVDSAPALADQSFGFYDPLSPADYDRIIDLYTDIVVALFDSNALDVATVGRLLGRKLPEFIEHRIRDAEQASGAADTDRADGADAVFKKYLAERERKYEEIGRRTTHPEGVRFFNEPDLQGAEPWRERTLAALASNNFDNESYAAAEAVYRSYLTEYPESDWGWVAAIRLGQTQVELHAIEAGRESLRAGAAKYASRPVARIAAFAFAAQASAALGDFAEELVDVKRALEAWDEDLSPDLSVSDASNYPYVKRYASAKTLTRSLNRKALSIRAADLTAKLAVPGGRDFEEALWWLDHGGADRALPILERLSRDAEPPIREQAADLIRPTRLDRALAWADVRNPDRNAGAAALEFETLAASSQDFYGTAAGMARAILAWKQSQPDEARRWMRETLEALQRNQQDVPAPPPGSIEEDVLAIREIAFGPDSRFSLRARDADQNRLPGGPHPYVFSSAVTPVVPPGGHEQKVVIGKSLQRLPNVLFLAPEQAALLSKVLNAFGADESQTSAPSQALLLLQEFFPAWSHRGMVVSAFADLPEWRFTGEPHVSVIEFVDELRTKAEASINRGSIGGKLLFEKRNGTWVATGEGEKWFTMN